MLFFYLSSNLSIQTCVEVEKAVGLLCSWIVSVWKRSVARKQLGVLSDVVDSFICAAHVYLFLLFRLDICHGIRLVLFLERRIVHGFIRLFVGQFRSRVVGDGKIHAA